MSLRATSLIATFAVLASLCAIAQVDDIRGYSSAGTNSISGQLRSFDDKPIGDARVELRSVESSETIGFTYTSGSGVFELFNVPKGRYELIASRGVVETREQITVTEFDVQHDLRINVPVDSPEATVSVATLKVPDKARKEYERGQSALEKQELEKASTHAEKALAIAPKYAEALTLRALVKLSQGKAEEGMVDLEAAIEANPDYGMAYLVMGAAHNRASRFQEATRTLTRGLALQPTAWQGYFELAKASMGQGDYNAALKYVDRAAGMNTKYPPIHLVRAHALLGLRQYNEAVSSLELYLTREPSGPNSASARRALSQAKAFVASGGK